MPIKKIIIFLLLSSIIEAHAQSSIAELSLNQYYIPNFDQSGENESYTSLNFTLGSYKFAAFTFGIGIGYDMNNLGNSEVLSPNFGVLAHTKLKNDDYLVYSVRLFGKMQVPEYWESGNELNIWLGIGYKMRLLTNFSVSPMIYLANFQQPSFGLGASYDFKSRQ